MADWLAVDGTNWVHQLYHALDGKDVLQVAASRLQAFNVQGCPSWGEKTSARALVRVGSIDAMLQSPWSIGATGKQLALLQAWAKSGAKDLAQQLVRLRTDVAAVWDAVL